MAGVGALTIFSFGMISKLFYEAIETIDDGPIEALTSVGANGVQNCVCGYSASYESILKLFPLYIGNQCACFNSSRYLGAGGVGLYLDQTLSLFRSIGQP